LHSPHMCLQMKAPQVAKGVRTSIDIVHGI